MSGMVPKYIICRFISLGLNQIKACKEHCKGKRKKSKMSSTKLSKFSGKSLVALFKPNYLVISKSY